MLKPFERKSCRHFSAPTPARTLYEPLGINPLPSCLDTVLSLENKPVHIQAIIASNVPPL